MTRVSPDFLKEPPLPEALLAPPAAGYSQVFLRSSVLATESGPQLPDVQN